VPCPYNKEWHSYHLSHAVSFLLLVFFEALNNKPGLVQSRVNSQGVAISTHHKVEILSPIKLVRRWIFFFGLVFSVWFGFFLVCLNFFLVFFGFRLIKPNRTGQFFQNFNRFFFYGSVFSIIFFQFSQFFSFFTHP
jgi:hypothetical protein